MHCRESPGLQYKMECKRNASRGESKAHSTEKKMKGLKVKYMKIDLTNMNKGA